MASKKDTNEAPKGSKRSRKNVAESNAASLVTEANTPVELQEGTLQEATDEATAKLSKAAVDAVELCKTNSIAGEAAIQAFIATKPKTEECVALAEALELLNLELTIANQTKKHTFPGKPLLTKKMATDFKAVMRQPIMMVSAAMTGPLLVVDQWLADVINTAKEGRHDVDLTFEMTGTQYQALNAFMKYELPGGYNTALAIQNLASYLRGVTQSISADNANMQRIANAARLVRDAANAPAPQPEA